MNDNILIASSLLIALVSLALSSRKSGYIVGNGVSFKDKYTVNEEAIGGCIVILLVVIIGSIAVGVIFSRDMPTILTLAVMNTCFIGYALAWEKVIKLK